jgi:hypothetical protein
LLVGGARTIRRYWISFGEESPNVDNTIAMHILYDARLKMLKIKKEMKLKE